MIAFLLAAAAVAAPAPQTRIPFFAADGAIDRRIVGDRDIYVRGKLGTWYHAHTRWHCSRLAQASAITFETAPNGDLDARSTVVAEGQRCPFDSLVAEAPPPRRHRR